MNYLKSFPFFCLFNLLIWSCQSGQDHQTHHHSESESQATGAVAELEKQVLAVHDSLMPQMSDLMELQAEVTAKIARADAPAKARGAQISQQLTAADDAMTDWMHQYKGDTLSQLSQEQALAYLKIQQGKVETVRQHLRQSLADARKYLAE
ncbi:hypothetical protein GCM10027347_05970 [Larkinella harenae]